MYCDWLVMIGHEYSLSLCLSTSQAQVVCYCYVRFQNLANVYVKRYPGLNINIDAELAWYKVCVSLSLSVCLSVCLSLCLSLCLSVSLSVCFCLPLMLLIARWVPDVQTQPKRFEI